MLPHPGDPDPNRIINNFPDALRHRARIGRPMIRQGWLERGPGADNRRGRDEFVEMEWDAVLDVLSEELRRVRDKYGPGAVFGGSYGWASAGIFTTRRAKSIACQHLSRGLCSLGEQLQFRRIVGARPARPWRL